MFKKIIVGVFLATLASVVVSVSGNTVTNAATVKYQSNTMLKGQCLNTNESMVYNNYGLKAQLVMQTDGNLVLYDANWKPFWATMTNGSGATRFCYQTNGNLTLYTAKNVAVWNSMTDGILSDQLNIDNITSSAPNGNGLRLTQFSQAQFGMQTVWTGAGSNRYAPQSQISINDSLSRGQQLVSPNSKYKAALQADGNFVVYNNQTGRALWHTSSYGRQTKIMYVGMLGGLVMYGGSTSDVIWSNQYWQGNTRNANRMVMQDDGNLVVYAPPSQGGGAVWATMTNNQ